jgi:tetratricopeptide (TPR) repeat protein
VKIPPRLWSLQELVSALQEQRVLIQHVLSCARCRSRIEAIFRDRRGTPIDQLAAVLVWRGRNQADYSQALATAEDQFLVHAQALARERAAAPARLAELLEQQPERREILMRNHRRFQSWGLLEHLIDHSWKKCFSDPLAAETSARLALSLADVLDEDCYGAERLEDLRARAWGFVGNALRIRFELDRSAAAFARAFTHLRKGTGDSLERALLFELQSSLLRAQRRLAEAEHVLVRALRIYRQLGETHRMGRVLVSMTIVYEQVGTPEKSIPLLHEALRLIDAEREPRLLWNAHHNLISVLAESGRFMEAQGLLIQARPLYAHFPDGHTQNRRHWVAGRIARGLGQAREAEAHLQAARDGFITDGATYDAAVVSLDLASLYAEQGRTAKLKQIAEETLTIFSSRQIHREALAALSFLQQAAVAERASLELVTGVTKFLKRLQNDPDLAFVQPATS